MRVLGVTLDRRLFFFYRVSTMPSSNRQHLLNAASPNNLLLLIDKENWNHSTIRSIILLNQFSVKIHVQ